MFHNQDKEKELKSVKGLHPKSFVIEYIDIVAYNFDIYKGKFAKNVEKSRIL